METKDIIASGVMAFALVLMVAMYFLLEEYLLLREEVMLVIFFVAVMVSVVVRTVPSKASPEANPHRSYSMVRIGKLVSHLRYLQGRGLGAAKGEKEWDLPL